MRKLLPGTLARAFLFCLLLWLAIFPGSPARAAGADPDYGDKKVLVLFSYGDGLTAYEKISGAFSSTIKQAGINGDNLYYEKLDLTRSNSRDYRQALHAMLAAKYGKKHIDLIVAVHEPAVQFILDEGRDIAPDAPILTLMLLDEAAARVTSPRVRNLPYAVDFRGTLACALALFPKTRRVVLVNGSDSVGQGYDLLERVAFAPWTGKLSFEYTSALGHAQMKQRIGALPSDAIVIAGAYYSDSGTRSFVPEDVVREVAEQANVPVFSLWEPVLGHGIVGGSLLSVEERGRQGGMAALDMLAGTTLPGPAFRDKYRGGHLKLFDWVQLQRWNGDVSALPAGSSFVNRPLTFWGQYRKLSVAAILAMFVLGALVVGLLIQNRRRMRAEQLSRDNAAQLRNLVQTIPDVIWLKDLKGIYQACNPACERLVGVSEAQLIGKADPEIFGQEPARAFRSTDQAVIAAGLAHTYEEWVKGPDGRSSLMLNTIAPTKAQDGTVTGVLGIGRDVTYLKETEKALRDLNETLEQRVHQRTSELALAVDAAEAANRAKGEFLANMSHEIRTPMNAVLGLTDLALHADPSPRQRDYLVKVKSAAGCLLSIIDDILDFSKIEAGKLTMANTDFDLAQVLRDLMPLMAGRAQEKGLEFLFDVAPDVPMWLNGDPLRLRQILVNLCSNAVKFTAQGAVVLAVNRQPGDGPIALNFCVTDTGIGMAEEQLRQLFTPFNQADSSSSRKYGGTGLGLAICKQLVALMGGQIRADSALGRGSSFHFDARFGAGQAALQQAPPTSDDDLPALRVICLQHSPAASGILEALLRQLGHEPVFRTSLEAGLEAMERSQRGGARFDLVLLAGGKLQAEALACARLVRSDPGRFGTPRILLACDYGQDDPEHIDPALVDALTSKPYCMDSVRKGLHAALRGGALERADPEHGPHVDQGKLAADLARIRGMRVLLCEDNEINQQVAKEFLHTFAAIDVTIAADGLKGVAALREGEFDAVLMDVQMPHMDGYEATARIRSEPAWQQLPIIAMTAHAMTGDREKCLDAGMNDFVTKPFEPAELYGALARWTRRGPGASAKDSDTVGAGAQAGSETSPPHAPAAEPAPPHASAAPLPTSGFDPHVALGHCAGNRALMENLLRLFLRSRSDAPAEIRAAIAAGNAPSALALLHTLRSNAGTFGAGALVSAIAQLEKCIASGQLDGAQVLVDHFEGAFHDFTASVRAHLCADVS